MRIIIYARDAAHQRVHAEAMTAGFARHGLRAEVGSPRRYGSPHRHVPADVAIVWGWRQRQTIAPARRVLVMERGYLPDRMEWTSLAWDGLNGRGRFPDPGDGGERFAAHWGHLLRPWREPGSGSYALLIGQMPRDSALGGLDMTAWLRETAARLQALGHRVRFRPHPLFIRAESPAAIKAQCPPGAELAIGPLEADLDGAETVVTFNSNTGVEAALAGVPVVAMDEGSMAWPVAAHGLNEAPARPDRGEWCRRLSWSQYTLSEIADGTAWEHARRVLQ